MADYKKMYHLLFNKITDITKELNDIQKQTEELYMNHDEKIIKLPVVKGIIKER